MPVFCITRRDARPRLSVMSFTCSWAQLSRAAPPPTQAREVVVGIRSQQKQKISPPTFDELPLTTFWWSLLWYVYHLLLSWKWEIWWYDVTNKKFIQIFKFIFLLIYILVRSTAECLTLKVYNLYRSLLYNSLESAAFPADPPQTFQSQSWSHST